MVNSGVIDPTYLPFPAVQLLPHLAPTGDQSADSEARRALQYYLKSADSYHAFLQASTDRRGMPISDLKRPCQIEKDERFWIAACLMTYWQDENQKEVFERLLRRCFGAEPPFPDMRSWDECLSGKLHLLFECGLPSPSSYKRWLSEHLRGRQIVPYVLDAARRKQSDHVRGALEGATRVDALLLSEQTGFAVVFEAKVLSDISCQVTYDSMRNQIVRSIDVMLEENACRPHPFDRRSPERSLFVLVTPQIFRDRPESRLYGWLLEEYRSDPSALARDLPHRRGVDWEGVARRLGWLTWEECEDVLAGACRWL